MSDSAAASSYGAQPSTPPINLVTESQNHHPQPEAQEEAWGLDYGTPGEVVEVPDGDEKFSPGIELDDTAKNKPSKKQNAKDAQPEQQGKKDVEAQLSPEKELAQLREERKNFKRGVYEKFQQVAQHAKQVQQREAHLNQITQQIQEKFFKNPLDVYDAIGGTPEQKLQWLENAATQLQNEMQKTPEQRELEKYKSKEAQFQKWAEQKKQVEAQQQEQAQVQQLEEGLSKFMIDAFTKRVGLPASPDRVRQMAMALGDYYEAGEPVDIERVADEAWDGFRTDVQRSLMTLREKSPEKLIEFIGEDNAKIIASQLGQKFAVNQHFKNHSKPKQPSAPSYDEQPKWIGMADVDEMRRKGQI